MLFTIGHSNKPFEAFLELLKAHDIQTLVDVRTNPYSRFCPHFNKAHFETELPKHNIAYDFKGKNLGGKGENVLFEETIEEITHRSNSGEILCLMCSEADPKKCHRFLDLAPLFITNGLEVKHIEWE